MTTTSAKPTSEANPPNKRGADYLSQRPFLSCGEIGTEYGLQRPKESLFHRNFMGMCDNARRKTSAVFGGLSMLYEFCAENFERVPAAIDAGARRIELCDNLAVGGTTPSAGVISATTNYAHEHDARVMCMIRPRGGDFHYNQDELRMMEMDLGLAVSAGVDGLVFGCCKPCAGGWALDELTLGALVMAAGCATEECKREPIDITFHMAFDQLSPEAQLDAIDILADCGITRILTHGGAAGTPIEDNLEHLSRLIECAGDRLTILPGGGISTANRDTVAAALGASELHGTKIVPLEV